MQVITIPEKDISKVYASNGFNGLQAVLKVKPHLTPQSAGVEAARMLKRASVVQEIDRLTDLLVDNNAHSKPQLLKRAYDYEVRAANDDKLSISLSSIDLQAKISGHYKESDGDESQFDKIINAFQVNIMVDNSVNTTVNVDDNVDNKCKDDVSVIDVDNSAVE
jgi:hypothetical protein